MKATIFVHGGADTPLEGMAKRGVIESALSGIRFSGSAVDMVQESVRLLEDDGHFGAGAGAPLGADGKVSLTANIMDGRTLQSGAVALMTGIRNPILTARKVMKETDNRILAGEFAARFARAFGFRESTEVTASRRKQYLALTKQLKLNKDLDYLVKWPKLRKLIRNQPGLFGIDTVGAIAMDRNGNLAAAGSSGGLALQLPGRISDVAIIGAGIFADNRVGAACVTGLGEFSIKYGVAREVCNLMKNGLTPSEASSMMVKLASKENVPFGVIALNPKGEWGGDWNSLPVMAHCRLSERGRPQFLQKQ
jgi:beta-aspartyl-peptidase (threonine type)